VDKPAFFVTPGAGEFMRDRFGYAQAVRVGGRVEISGQGGWNDAMEFPATLAEEVAQAFDNVGRVLAAAGAGWDHVIAVDTFHVDLDDTAIALVSAEYRRRMPSHMPIWTALGVARLGDPRMHIEVRATAVVA
jgi:enamine deaminase RidA (YjgF/YER057c/UK114 family)